jgi:hypothetical protein
VTCQRPGPFHGRCRPPADSSADLGLLARSPEVRPDVVHLHARRALAESQCPERSRPLVIASGTGGLTPGQVRPDGTGTVPPAAHMETGMQTGGHRGADPRPSWPRRPLVRAAAPADGARRRRKRVHEGHRRHRPRQWRLWPSSRSTSRHPARSPATGRLAAHPAGLVKDLAHVLAGWAVSSSRPGCRAGVTGAGSPVRVLAAGRAGPRRERARCAAWSSGSARRESCGEPASRHWPH